MTELKNTLLILKARWKEVAVIICFELLGRFSNEFLRLDMLNAETKLSIAEFNIFLYKAIPIANNVLTIFFFVISAILLVGLLRTLTLTPYQHTSALTLLKTGKHFFWRLFGFWVLFIVVEIILAWLIFSAVTLFTPAQMTFFESAKVSPWLYQLCCTIAMLLLAKLWLFTPSVVIVHDCKFSLGLKLLKYCSIFKAKELIATYFFSLIAFWLWVFLPIKHIWHIVPYIIPSFIGTVVSVMAVRFVTALNLPYDTEVSPLNPQGLLKPE